MEITLTAHNKHSKQKHELEIARNKYQALVKQNRVQEISIREKK